jgi:outer membrane protein TolC
MQTAGAPPGPAVPDAAQVEQLAAALERSPRVASALATLEADTARLAEWQARTSWQSSVVFTAQRDVPPGLVVFGGLSLTPPLFDRGERETGPLAQARARAQAGVAQARVDARTELQMLVHEVEHTGETLHLVEGSLVPPAAERLRLRELQLQQGHATVLEVLLARRAALGAQARAVTARADHGLARVRLFFLAQELTP